MSSSPQQKKKWEKILLLIISTFSIPKLLCRILNEYSNGSLGFYFMKKYVYLVKMTRTIYQTRWKMENQGKEERALGRRVLSTQPLTMNLNKKLRKWFNHEATIRTFFPRCVTAENLSLLPLCIICYPFELLSLSLSHLFWISWLQWLFLNVNETKLKCNFVAVVGSGGEQWFMLINFSSECGGNN